VKSLGFRGNLEGRSDSNNGKRIRLARFEARSWLPISAACVVANGTRETLSSLFAQPIVLRLFEPAIPSPDAWSMILLGARLYRVRGNIADAAVVLRAGDAIALAAALFGESPAAAATDRALSPIECDVVDRMVNAVAANLGAVCGAQEHRAVERVSTLAGFVTYFELLVEEPVAARIGIALSRDPSPETGGSIDLGHLAGVRLRAIVSLDAGTMEASAVARLSVGTRVPIASLALHRCSLTAHGRRVARGSCGVRNGRYAFSVDVRETI
jgi:hypothetical protein